MRSCNEASHLASKAMDVKLPWRERLELSLHLAMCDSCRGYVRDLKRLRRKVRQVGKSGKIFLSESVWLSERSRKRIEYTLRKAWAADESHDSDKQTR